MLDLVIRGGTVVTGHGVATADIGISDGRIAAISERINEPGSREITAAGQLVVPGAVDVHTHFANRIGSLVTADDYESGSRAAAAGGITSFVNVAFQTKGESLRATAEAELVRARGNSHLDFGIHLAVTDLDVPGILGEIPSLANEGFASLKAFTAVPGLGLNDSELLRLLDSAGRDGVMVNIHAEDQALIDYRTRVLDAAGETHVRNLPDSRPPLAEAIATARTAAYASATGCAVYFVHLSSRLALEAVRKAREDGAEVYVETRPAYLFLKSELYNLPDRQGNNYVCWPPLRSQEDQVSLWSGLATGEIQTYATDHTTYMSAEKTDPGLSFSQIPGGVSNVQTSIGMLYAEGVQKGHLSLERFVAVTATNPAKLFGMWPAKGELAVGGDADIVLIDPEWRFRVETAAMESRSDFDPYDGYDAVGWPRSVVAGGEVIVKDGQVTSSAGRGRFLTRSRYQAV